MMFHNTKRFHNINNTNLHSLCVGYKCSSVHLHKTSRNTSQPNNTDELLHKCSKRKFQLARLVPQIALLWVVLMTDFPVIALDHANTDGTAPSRSLIFLSLTISVLSFAAS